MTKRTLPPVIDLTNVLDASDLAAKRMGEVVVGRDVIPTMLPEWNRVCGDEGAGKGLAKGWYLVLGGATGKGKSLAATSLAAHALRYGVKIGVVSLEMSDQQMATRFWAQATNTPVRKLERGDNLDISALSRATAVLDKRRKDTGCGFFLNTQPIFKLTDVMALMDHYVSIGCGMIIVDYLQLVTSGDESQVTAEVTKVSHEVRVFKQLNPVVMIGLSQFNRITSANRDTPPTCHGLIGASALENDADQVLLLDHSRYQRVQEASTAKTWVILDKNRHGAQVEIPVLWDYETLDMNAVTEHEKPTWPGVK